MCHGQKDEWITFHRSARWEFLFSYRINRGDKDGLSCASLVRRNINNVNRSDETDKGVKRVRARPATGRFMLCGLVPLQIQTPGTLAMILTNPKRFHCPLLVWSFALTR